MRTSIVSISRDQLIDLTHELGEAPRPWPQTEKLVGVVHAGGDAGRMLFLMPDLLKIIIGVLIGAHGLLIGDIRVLAGHVAGEEFDAGSGFAGQAERAALRLIRIVDRDCIPEVKGDSFNHNCSG